MSTNKFVGLILVLLGVLFMVPGAALPVVDGYAVTINLEWLSLTEQTLPPLSMSTLSFSLGLLCLCAGWLRLNDRMQVG